MAQGKYQTQQLNVLLETTQRKGASGTWFYQNYQVNVSRVTK
jgi:hypothetical protein